MELVLSRLNFEEKFDSSRSRWRRVFGNELDEPMVGPSREYPRLFDLVLRHFLEIVSNTLREYVILNLTLAVAHWESCLAVISQPLRYQCRGEEGWCLLSKEKTSRLRLVDSSQNQDILL